MQWMENKKPIIINYGKGYFSDKEIKEKAEYDYSIGKYRDSTGIWEMKLLLEIARGEVKNTKIEIGG